MAYNDKNVIMEGVTIVNRNFSGKEGQYNREGDRNFNVLLDPKIAEQMAKDGWNIKEFKIREEGDEPQAFLGVTVSFKGRPPQIYMITSRGRNLIDEGMVEMLDSVDIKNVDMIIRPYEWLVNGKTGIKAYLQSLYVTIEENYLDLKYAELEDIRNPHGHDTTPPWDV